MVKRSDVIYAYRYLLGRDPENKRVITEKLSFADWEALRSEIIKSKEYAAHNSPTDMDRCLDGPKLEIDIELSPDDFSRLLGHVQRSWETLGREKPHWSVLTDPSYLPDKIGTASQFYTTGALDFQRLTAALARSGAALPQGTCLELGTGVGRVSAQLARHFQKVIGFDVSGPHLQLAEQYLRERDIRNVDLRKLSGLRDLENAGPVDCFYSILVLQHNPPPLMCAILDKVFNLIKPGGYAFFQVPVYSREYRFNLQEYLSLVERGIQSMEMHILPQQRVLSLAEAHGLRLIEIMDDGNSGAPFISQQFLFARR